MEKEHIIAYRVNGRIVCEECIEPDELIRLLGNEQDIIMSSSKEKICYFCDRCKKQISRDSF